jgi:hypothetical protein
MKPTMYKRGRYNKQHPKEKKITFLSDKLLIVNLKQLSVIKHKSMSQIIRDAVQEYFIRTIN